MEKHLQDENQRLDQMTAQVFTASSLRELKFAVLDIFDLFYEICTEPITSYTDLKTRLAAVNDKHWDKIRRNYIRNETVGYCHQEFTDTEKQSAVKILLDIASRLDQCSHSVVKKVEEKQTEMAELESKLNIENEKIRKLDAVIESQRNFYTEKVSENSDYNAQNMHLLQQIAAKNKQITELERNNNVQLWEREKQKLLKESHDKMASLEREIEELKQNNENFKRKIETRDTSYKQLKIRNQLQSERLNSPVPSSDENDDTMSHTKLSQRNYMQDKDIVYLEKQLYELQSTTCGVIGGIKTDFKQLAHKFIDPEEGKVDENFKILSSRMDRVYSAVASAEVEAVKEALPPHYRYIEDEKFKIKKIRRLSKPIINPSKSMLNHSLDDRKPVLGPIPPSQEHKNTLNGIKEDPINPVIIDTKTKRLHPINPLKYFPFMSQQFIKDQYEKFTQYDKSGDGYLDLNEMIEVVKEIGFDFNVHQLQDAMEEVDRDGNHTLDFFEYMLIIDNIYRKKGKAELFQQGMKEVRRKNMSKSCVVQ